MKTLQHSFVEFVPETIDEGILYISIPYSTAIHKCVCGCGNEVVTPISPNGWEMTFNGVNITLHPSIGNWNFKCRSHYFIRKSVIIQAKPWNDDISEEENLSADSQKSGISNRRKKFWRKRKARKGKSD